MTESNTRVTAEVRFVANDYLHSLAVGMGANAAGWQTRAEVADAKLNELVRRLRAWAAEERSWGGEDRADEIDCIVDDFAPRPPRPPRCARCGELRECYPMHGVPLPDPHGMAHDFEPAPPCQVVR